MSYNKIKNRIYELETMKEEMDTKLARKRVELASKQAEVQIIQDEVNKNMFENTEEYHELRELRSAVKTYEEFGEEESNLNMIHLSNTINELKETVKKLIRIDEITEEELEDFIALYDTWESRINTKIEKNELIQYKGQLYKSLLDHIAEEQFNPEIANYRYVLAIAPEEVVGEWREPGGYQDAYNTGDKIIYEDEIYECLEDGVVHNPTVRPEAWQKLDEEGNPIDGGDEENSEPSDPEIEEEDEDIPEFVTPAGYQDVYNTGEKVRYNGKIYICLEDGVAHAPDVVPDAWEEVK